jgi:hypothetical protein
MSFPPRVHCGPHIHGSDTAGKQVLPALQKASNIHAYGFSLPMPRHSMLKVIQHRLPIA